MIEGLFYNQSAPGLLGVGRSVFPIRKYKLDCLPLRRAGRRSAPACPTIRCRHMTSRTTRYGCKGRNMSNNLIALDQALADKFTALLGTIRKNIVELATTAATVRNQYLSGSGKSYEPEFHQFWKIYSMENKFGSLSTFAKYANIGDAIEKVRARYERYQDRLPTTMTALYEFSQLLDDELELCLEDHWVRTEITPDRERWKRKGRKACSSYQPVRYRRRYQDVAHALAQPETAADRQAPHCPR